MAKPRNSRARAGFTLVEIMVALTVGGIAIGSLYAVGSASTRQFRDQQRVSAAQTSLRSAMDQLKHDFQRAGFMSTPNSLLAGETCAPPQSINGQNNRLSAVFAYAKAVTAPSKLDPGGLNTPASSSTSVPFFTLDDVTLSGNFATSGEYPNISIDSDALTIRIPMVWQSFRRDFTEWSGVNAGDCNAAAFDQAFTVGRLVRLRAMNGNMFYSRVARTTCVGNGRSGSSDTATVTLTETVPVTCNMTGGWIAPVNTMHYGVVDATAAEDSTDARMTVLRRTEVQPNARTLPLTTVASNGLPIEDRALLDYVVKFNVDFIMRDANTRRMNYVPRTATEVMTDPERVRGVVLEVAVRTAQSEPDFTSFVPQGMFRVNARGPGAARVRRARAELLLPNIANRGL